MELQTLKVPEKCLCTAITVPITQKGYDKHYMYVEIRGKLDHIIATSDPLPVPILPTTTNETTSVRFMFKNPVTLYPKHTYTINFFITDHYINIGTPSPEYDIIIEDDTK